METSNRSSLAGGWRQLAAILVAAIVLYLGRGFWLPSVSSWGRSVVASFRPSHAAINSHRHHAAADAHAHAGHDADASLELSAQALRNIGLTQDKIRPIRLETFRKSLTVPAVIVERPGRTTVQVATPMTGVITHVHALKGEAVEVGSLLFRIRLTHEDLVRAQTEFVKTLGELDVERREIARLSKLNSGAVAGKVLLERKYSRDKLTALLQAQREALRLHGLSSQQVDQIATNRRLLQELRIVAPSTDDHDHDELQLSKVAVRTVAFTSLMQDNENANVATNRPMILQQLDVHKGQSVMAGETLCVLADYSELFIEGLAFEQDVRRLRRAAQNEWPVQAIFQTGDAETDVLDGMEIAYLASRVDTSSRTLHFYVRLSNELASDRVANGNRFVGWKYLPGQRLQLRVPVEQWERQIVLPVDAVAREGAEYFVFQQNGDHFDRVSVHVKHKDQISVVIENDGSLFPGDVVAMRGAHQMQMALKNKSGGAVDPHAGHQH